MGKNLPAVPEIWVQCLGWEDPILEKGMATHSSIIAWKVPWTEELGGLQLMGLQRSRTQLSDLTTTFPASTRASFHRHDCFLTSNRPAQAGCTAVGLNVADEPTVKFLEARRTLPTEADAAIAFLILF